ncbi:THO complex subunit 4 [Oopsacas minuta]|uniref:THO complex subunit 4 n=1 Tax=Oopsacas minuta TaxID=111878 RepID=A0AAV7JPY9_9METZ|nr:THO complex subunit 4 [Oopsacas minuta]
MAEEMADLSLEDIIKKTGISRSGRGGDRGSRSRRGSSRRGGGLSAPRDSFRSGSYNLQSSERLDRWQHDMYRGQFVRDRDRYSGAKLNISNLDFGVSDSDIEELFGEFGPVKKAGVHYDFSGRSKGTAEVIYFRSEDAEKAIKQYNGVPLDGRPMKIEIVTGNPSSSSRITSRRPSRRIGGRGASRSLSSPKTPRVMPTAEELDAQLENYQAEKEK